MRSLALALPCLLATALFAQVGLTLPRSGNTQRSAVTQFIGPVKVSIEYGSPAVHAPDGSDRRGQIWGKLVPYGLTDLGFGHRKPSPWRAGADENTVFETTNDVLIQGKPLPAGRYGLHMITGPSEWTLIFSKNSTSWGSFFYEESEDALRVNVKPAKHDYREWLTYEFTARKPAEATAEMQWEDLAVSWTVAVPNIEEIYLSKLRQELRTTPGFSFQGLNAAAQYCLQIGKNYEEGLKWAEAAVSMPFIGRAQFSTLSTKAQLLSRLGRESEAKEVMQAALAHPATLPVEIHQYGRQLLAAKKVPEALEVFQFNAKRNGDTWPVHVGLARGYAATGEKAKALEHAKKALAQAPDEINRKNLEGMVKELSSGS
ncbi:MAG: DUF2911 domain-containing protein [Bryobacteraceae bacterium]|nr:DUF2911 domain-containing protein [Bryobacteraceae bacterium]